MRPSGPGSVNAQSRASSRTTGGEVLFGACTIPWPAARLERWLVVVAGRGDGLCLVVGVAQVGPGGVLPCANVTAEGMDVTAAVLQQPVHGAVADDEAGAADVLLDHHEQLCRTGHWEGSD